MPPYTGKTIGYAVETYLPLSIGAVLACNEDKRALRAWASEPANNDD